MPLSQTTIPTAFAAATSATGQQLDDDFNALKSAVNSPFSPSNYLLDTGTANVYAVAFATGIVPTYTAGLPVQMLVLHSNSGASTLNVNSLGAKNILRPTGVALSANDLVAGAVANLMYDGTQFQLLNPGAAAAISYLTGMTTIASAATPDIFANTVAATVQYTGTVTCTGFVAAPEAGAQRKLYCTGAAPFTAGANLIIEGITSGTTITLAAGAVVDVFAITTTQFKMTYSLSGTFTATGTGYTVNPTATAKYVVTNGAVNISIPQNSLTGTSNATTFTITGLPAAISSSTNREVNLMYGADNGSGVVISGYLSSSTIILRNGVSGSLLWTASGTKTLTASEFHYTIS